MNEESRLLEVLKKLNNQIRLKSDLYCWSLVADLAAAGRAIDTYNKEYLKNNYLVEGKSLNSEEQDIRDYLWEVNLI